MLGKLQPYKLPPTKFYEKGHRLQTRLISSCTSIDTMGHEANIFAFDHIYVS